MIAHSQHEGVLTLRLAHGKASALDIELLDALARELDGAAEDVRALVLTGTGSIFSAGVDLFRLTQGGADYVRHFLPLLRHVPRWMVPGSRFKLGARALAFAHRSLGPRDATPRSVSTRTARPRTTSPGAPRRPSSSAAARPTSSAATASAGRFIFK